MELQNQMHQLQAKATLGSVMVSPDYFGFACMIVSQETNFFAIFCSVSDLLDYISSDQDFKRSDVHKKQRRAKVN